jgi:hypothetical protein
LACSFSHCAAALFPYKMLLHIFILFWLTRGH